MEPYRSELHKNPADTFAHFGITNSAYGQFLSINESRGSKTVRAELATAERMLQAAVDIETASAAIRANGGKTAAPPLPALIEQFLGFAASWVAAEVALGITEPDQPVADKPGELIRKMYLLLYCSAFRSKPDRGAFDEKAWNAVLAAVEKGEGSFDELLPHCRTLCAQVADEFIGSLWPDIW